MNVVPLPIRFLGSYVVSSLILLVNSGYLSSFFREPVHSKLGSTGVTDAIPGK